MPTLLTERAVERNRFARGIFLGVKRKKGTKLQKLFFLYSPGLLHPLPWRLQLPCTQTVPPSLILSPSTQPHP